VLGAHRFYSGLLRPYPLQFDQQMHLVANSLQHFIQRRNTLTLSGVEAANTRGGQVSNRALSIGCAIHRGVVHHNQLPVAGQMHVTFHIIYAQINRKLKTLERIFRH
jgi:hypothetical protein